MFLLFYGHWINLFPSRSTSILAMPNLIMGEGLNVSNFSLPCEFRMIKKEILLQLCVKLGKRCKETQEKAENGTVLWTWWWWS